MLGFLKPKWQHDDAAIRLQAIAELEDEDTLLEIVNTDSNLEVRRAALARMASIDKLLGLSTDTQVGNDADSRLRELLIQHAKTLEYTDDIAHWLALRDESIDALQDNADPRFALFTDNTTVENSVLIDLCAESGSTAVRQRAAARIEDEKPVREAQQRVGDKDKKVNQILREKLAAIRAVKEKQARADELTQSLATLGKASAWENDVQSVEALEKDWIAIADALDSARHAKWRSALDTVQEKIAENRRQAEALQPVHEEKTAICARLESEQERLQQASQTLPERQQLSATRQLLKDSSTRWRELPRLADHLEEDLVERFGDAVNACERWVARGLKLLDSVTAYEKLLAKARKLSNDDKLSRKRIEQLDEQWQTLSPPDDKSLKSLLNDQFQNAQQANRKQLDTIEQAREKQLEQIDRLMTQLEAELEDNNSINASNTHRELMTSLQSAKLLRPSMRTAVNKRLAKLTPQLKELERWRHWSGDQARQQLIDEASELAKSRLGVKKRIKAVKDLRDKWKDLGQLDPVSGQKLWQKFDAACSEAWEPVKQARDEENAARDRSLAQRQALCERLEKLASETDWKAPEWREIDKEIGAIRNRWRKTGAVRNRDWKKINERFNKAMESLDTYLEDERRRCANRRKTLVSKVKAAADLDDVGEAINIAKQAQKDWAPTVLLRHKEERELWQEFRGAVDALFDRSKAARQARIEESDSLHAQKKQVCDALQTLLGMDEEQLLSAQSDVLKLKSQWDDIPGSRDRRTAATEKRYAKLCRQLDSKLERQRAASQANHLNERLRGKMSNTDVAADADSLQTALIELEIILELDSPPEQSKARMQLQVERMADAMSSGIARGREEIEQLCSKVGDQIAAGSVLPDIDARLDAVANQLPDTLAKIEAAS